jgi:hypothetical protein
MQEQNSESEEMNETLEFQKKSLREEMPPEEFDDEQYSEPEHHDIAPDDLTPEDTKKNIDLSIQTQKIILNEAEESPTYKDFFEKDQIRSMKESKGSPKKKNDGSPRKTDGGSPRKTDGGSPRKNDGSPRRWKLLYDKAIESRETKEEIRRDVEKNKKEDTECTFSPKLVASFKKRASSPTLIEKEELLSVQERNKLWKSKVDNKLVQSRESVRDKELNHCTFVPDIAKSQRRDDKNHTMSNFQSKGVDSYLRRQIIAKQTKDEKEMIRNNPLTKLPAHVYKKEGKITIPKGPDFSKGKYMDVNSLKKPFQVFSARTYDGTLSASPIKNVLQREIQVLVDPVHVKNVTFGEAIHQLHSELYKFNMDMDIDSN